MDSEPPAPSPMIKCIRCPVNQPINQFPLKQRGGGYLPTCASCTAKAKANNAKQRQRQKQGNNENQPVRETREVSREAHNAAQGLVLRETVSWNTLEERLAMGRKAGCSVDVVFGRSGSVRFTHILGEP